jgi:hypothetical protein
MIQGETAVVRISDIIISRGERLRGELKPERVAELAESIARLGPIHFPVITRDMTLVSGETRLAAYRHLGWDRCTVTWADTLDEDELLAIELEENVKRTDLTWQEQCSAIQRFHALRLRTEDTWSQTKTAEALGMSQARVNEALMIVAAIAGGNARVAAAPLLSTARNVARRAAERLASDEAVMLATIEGDIDVSPERSEGPILNTDFCEWVSDYRGPPFNFLHCDFPYGINAERFNQSAGGEFGTYKDDFSTYEGLIETLTENRHRLLGDSGHIIFWFSMRHYDFTLRALTRHFWVDPYPLAWIKSDNKGTLPDPQRGPRRIYEVAFLCSHGDRKIIAPVSNAFSAPTERSGDHMSEKSQPMLEHFMRMIVDENTRMLDPTCGSGSALRAADRLGASFVLGLERDAEFAANAQRAWEKRNEL